MATTPGGLPYPVGTDKVVDGDDAIHALALGVDDRIRGRRVSAVTDGTGVVVVAHGMSVTPTFAVVSMGNGGVDTVSLLTSAIIFGIDATNIAVAFRREDTNQWFPGQPVVFYLEYGWSAFPAVGTLPESAETLPILLAEPEPEES